MKIFGIKIKPLFQRSGYSYTHAAARHKEKRIDTKAIFADGVALGRMLAGEAEKVASVAVKPRRRKR